MNLSIQRPSFKSIMGNAPFFISAMAASCLFFLAILNSKGIVLFAGILAVICVLFPLGPCYLRHQMTAGRTLFSTVVSMLMTNAYIGTMGSNTSMAAIASYLHMEPAMLVNASAVLGGTVSVYFVLYVTCLAIDKLELQAELQVLKNELLSIKNVRKIVAALFFVYLIAICALLIADVEYIDDMQRKADGEPGFTLFSRFTASLLSKLLNTGPYLADISPLPQLIAVLLIAVASMVVLVIFVPNKKISLIHMAAVLPLGISPYFLECISYKFDAPYMALSLLCNLLPLLFYSRSMLLYIVTTIICMLIACTTYQASLGIFPVAVAALAFVKWRDGDSLASSVRLILRSIIGYVSGILIFRVFILHTFDDYVSTDLHPLRQMPMGVYNNLKNYLTYVIDDFDWKWLVCIAVILISFVVLSAMHTKRSKSLTMLLSAITVIVCISLSFGLYIAFTTPLYACRAMFGFGVCIAIFAVLCCNFKSAQVTKLACLYLSFCLFVFSFVYGNALEERDRYVKFRMEQVLTDLSDVEQFRGEHPVKIQIIGGIGESPVLASMPQMEGVLGRLVQTSFSGSSWVWNEYYFYHYYGLRNFTVVTDLSPDALPILTDGYYHTIYGDGENILIQLKSVS